MSSAVFDPFELTFHLVTFIRKSPDEFDALGTDDLGGLARVISEASQPTSEFAGMKRAYLRRRLGADIRMPLTIPEVLTYLRGGELPRVPAHPSARE